MALRMKDIRKQSLEGKVARYDVIRSQIKALNEEKDSLAKEIKEYATSEGVKDSTGSFFCDNGSYVFGSVARIKRTLNKDKAIKLLKDKHYFTCIKKVEVVDESAVEKYLDEGKLTIEDLDSITDVNTTYSVSVTPKEEMPEVEQTTFAVAASSKPRLRFRR